MSFNTTDKREYTTKDASGSPEAFRKVDTKTATLLVRNVGTKTASYTIQGSIDGETWVDLTEAADLTEGKSKVHSITDYWPFLQVSAKSKEAGKATKLAVAMASIDS